MIAVVRKMGIDELIDRPDGARRERPACCTGTIAEIVWAFTRRPGGCRAFM
jgi:hypothetical protein